MLSTMYSFLFYLYDNFCQLREVVSLYYENYTITLLLYSL